MSKASKQRWRTKAKHFWNKLPKKIRRTMRGSLNHSWVQEYEVVARSIRVHEEVFNCSLDDAKAEVKQLFDKANLMLSAEEHKKQFVDNLNIERDGNRLSWTVTLPVSVHMVKDNDTV